jgi:large subunit ribosomal protein L29
MVAIKKKKLREMDEKQLVEQLKELRLELSKERAASEIGTAKNPGRIKAVRKNIARILTILNEKKWG